MVEIEVLQRLDRIANNLEDILKVLGAKKKPEEFKGLDSILTPEQRASGLHVREDDDHTVELYRLRPSGQKFDLAIFNQDAATIVAIRETAEHYL